MSFSSDLFWNKDLDHLRLKDLVLQVWIRMKNLNLRKNRRIEELD